MMDGPTHYEEAEKSFHKAKEAARLVDGASAVLYMQAAQWHASMAQAAATAESIEVPYRRAAWLAAFYPEGTEAQGT
jgi:hypothetical protein